MKNITVSVDDEIYRRARILAAQRDTSISALVREFLASLGEPTNDEQTRAKAWAQLWKSIGVSNAKVGKRPTRARTYDDRRFHRY